MGQRLLNALAVPSKPGLTTAQLMLTNHDLKPGLWNQPMRAEY